MSHCSSQVSSTSPISPTPSRNVRSVRTEATRSKSPRTGSASICRAVRSLARFESPRRFRLGFARSGRRIPGPGPVNGGSGVFSFVGGVATAEYSIPWGQGSGALTLNGTTHDISGNVWFDRQWTFTRDLFGNGPDSTTLQDSGISWSWMDLNLDTGDVVSLWDVNFHGNQYNWVTALEPMAHISSPT